jgi:phosphate:Na+ symporter
VIVTPEISILQAQKEIVHFAERMQRMFGMIRVLLDEKNKKEFERQYERIEHYETIADNMEIEIATYLEQLGNEHLSDDTKDKIRIMFRQIGELESIGDACFKTARTIQHLRNSREDFTSTQYTHLHDMLHLVNEALTQMMVVVNGRRDDLTIDASQDIENDINTLRDQLRAESLKDVDAQHYSYALGTLYTDIISDCERLGDYVMNVVEARLGKRYLAFQGLQMNLDRKTITVDSKPVSLTRTEFDLLYMLLSNKGHVLSRQQLMDTLWAGVIITDRTINVHINRLRKKLGPYANNVVCRTGHGYVFE